MLAALSANASLIQRAHTRMPHGWAWRGRAWFYTLPPDHQRLRTGSSGKRERTRATYGVPGALSNGMSGAELPCRIMPPLATWLSLKSIRTCENIYVARHELSPHTINHRSLFLATATYAPLYLHIQLGSVLFAYLVKVILIDAAAT